MQIKQVLFRKTTGLILILLVFVVELFVYSTRQEGENAASFEQHKLSAFELNHDIDFCGEKVPLYSRDILERYEREVLKNALWHSEMILLHKRTGKYFPIIERILKANGVPDDFKYLCMIESGLDNVVSPAGAAGFWQIMEQTGKEFGLTVSEEVDERYHLEKATRAACRYFKQAYEKFGSWTLVAASYNIGMSGLERRMKAQDTDNYYDLLLNSETARYVFRILAVKDILEHPKRYNFDFIKEERYQPYKIYTLTVDSSVPSWSDWAKQQAVNYKILKLFNPWLRTAKLTNPDSTKYVLQMPKEQIYIFSGDTTDAPNVAVKNDSTLTEND